MMRPDGKMKQPFEARGDAKCQWRPETSESIAGAIDRPRDGAQHRSKGQHAIINHFVTHFVGGHNYAEKDIDRARRTAQ